MEVSVEFGLRGWIALLEAQAVKNTTTKRRVKIRVGMGLRENLFLPLQLKLTDGHRVTFLYASLAQGYIHAERFHDLLEAAY